MGAHSFSLSVSIRAVFCWVVIILGLQINALEAGLNINLFPPAHAQSAPPAKPAPSQDMPKNPQAVPQTQSEAQRLLQKRNEDPDKSYTVALMLSSQPGAVSATIDAIKQFSQKAINDINQSGGINGRPLKLRIWDDFEKAENTVKNVDEALQVKNLLAIIGIWSSTRGKQVIEKIGQSGVPFISEMSLTKNFASYRSIFSLTRSVSDETRMFKKFMADTYQSTAFLGVAKDLFTKEFRDALDDVSPDFLITSEHWTPEQPKLDPDAVEKAIAAIKAQQPDSLTLAVGSNRGAAFLKRMVKEGLHIPVFVATGSILRLQRNLGDVRYLGPLYQVATSVPHVDSERLAQLKRRPNFALSLANFASDDIGYGVTYGDMIALLQRAAKDGRKSDEESAGGEEKKLALNELRKNIVDGLNSFLVGAKFYRGLWRDWTFTAERSSSENSLLLWRPANSSSPKLWHTQYQRGSKDTLKPIPVIYAGVDMVRVFSINSNAKTFDAEFYFSMASNQDVDISNIEFTNALRGEANDEQLITIRKIHEGTAEGEGVLGSDPKLKVYKIDGRFLFQPGLKNYPFDQQSFSISFQPKSMTNPLIIQPSPKKLRDRDFHVLGWKLIDGAHGEYVGFDQDMISTLQNYASAQKILPFNKFNFTWILQREALDYYLRVVVPLFLILLVAYFSIFIPNSRIDSVVGIQVTALLSTIALYLAIPKLDTDTSTLSDQIFVFTEVVIVSLILLSIFRVHSAVKEAPLFGLAITGLQLFFFPIMAFLMFRYVSLVRSDTMLSSKPVIEIFRKLVWLNAPT